jgi:hypothetical protein
MPSASVPSDFIYRTSTLVESFSQVPIAPSFLRDQMFPRAITAATDQVSVEFFRGNQKLAAPRKTSSRKDLRRGDRAHREEKTPNPRVCMNEAETTSAGSVKAMPKKGRVQG